MKNSIVRLAVTAAALFAFTGCKKDDPAPPANNTPKAVFTAKIDGDVYNAPDSSYILNGAGNAIAVFSNEASGRSFQMAIFEKDYPAGKTVGIAFTPSLAYKDGKGALYIAKEGSLTVTEYGKNDLGVVNHMVGTFAATMTADAKEIQITEGRFDVRTR